MKTSLLLTTIFGLQALAFPAALMNGEVSASELGRITELANKIATESKKRQAGLNIVDVGFDAKAQKIDTSGDHAYRSPGDGDIRGPCPGLNALANHGYIPRNGVASVVELTLASNKVYGMGHDLAGFLSAYSGIMSGDLTSVSIGGAAPLGLIDSIGGTLGLLGKPQGLSGSHNRFEADASPTRADLYTSGDADSLNLEQFEQLVSMPKGPKGYDYTVLHPFRGARFNHSVATNGYFFAGPFTNFAVNTATYVFTYRFFANHSSEHPDGYLDIESLMAFEGVTRDANGKFEWKKGQEHIPENWYRRAIGDDFGLPAFVLDAVDALAHLPYVIVVGGNTGKPNTFTGVNVANLTGGVFNAETLLEGNNIMCVAFQAINGVAPDILKGLVGNVLLAVQKLTEVLTPLIDELGCPQLAKFDTTAFGKFPGAQGGI